MVYVHRLGEVEPRPYGSWLIAELEGPNLQGRKGRTFSRKIPLLNETHSMAKLPPCVPETGVGVEEEVVVNRAAGNSAMKQASLPLPH
ncbi:hypothetical protein Pyn_26324 [Prunus yedoensis var. nudiflora]|uniref:Uncharacterized protein n=1 Tax=Prunus yedoensis var. nudiflora TaxID=2094558 RepID=A0A314ZU31_PRUYE|nr:hypothetical protein Pyn_26324 [Prunus yedoensis var. nudiflora]